MTRRRRADPPAAEPEPKPPAAPGFKSVTTEELRRVTRQSAALLALAERTNPEDLTRLGLSEAQVEEVRASLRQTERSIPSARNTVLATFSGDLSKEIILSAYTRAQRALHALAPLVVLRLAEKVDDDQAPGSTKVLLEIAHGLGLLVPAQPVTAEERADLLTLDGERRKPVDQLKDEVLRESA